MREMILQRINSNLKKMRHDFAVQRIGLFGSIARDEGSSTSDVDILVDFSEPTFDHYMDLKFYLEDLLGRDVDLVMADTLKARIKPTIEREVVYAQGS